MKADLLRTWIFTVMINIAKTRGVRERRDSDAEIAAFTGDTVDPARFRPDGRRWPGHRRADAEPSLFPETPEGSVLGGELVAVARRELDRLPDRQRTVGPGGTSGTPRVLSAVLRHPTETATQRGPSRAKDTASQSI